MVHSENGARLARWLERLPPPLQIAVTTITRFVRQEMSTYAAALAYRGVLAIFPFVIFVIALINAIDLWQVFGLVGDWAWATPEARLPRAIRQWLVAQLQQQSEGAAISVGAVAAVWAVASGARVLRTALNVAGDLPEHRPVWSRTFMSLLAAPAVAAAVITIVSLFLLTGQALVQVGRWFHVNEWLLLTWDWVRWPSGVLVAFAVVVAIYRLLPSERLSCRSLMPGALTTVLVWAVASSLLPNALSGVFQFGITYGSFSAAVVLLVYGYVNSAGLLLGAELNAVMRAANRHRVCAAGLSRSKEAPALRDFT